MLLFPEKYFGRIAVAASRADVVRARKAIPLFIWNEDMDEIISIIKELENSGILIDNVSEIVKQEIKNIDFLE